MTEYKFGAANCHYRVGEEKRVGKLLWPSPRQLSCELSAIDIVMARLGSSNLILETAIDSAKR
jgi:hypothetical protein